MNGNLPSQKSTSRNKMLSSSLTEQCLGNKHQKRTCSDHKYSIQFAHTLLQTF